MRNVRHWRLFSRSTPITVGDVLTSRMIAYRFRLLQCCRWQRALILVAAERAKDFPQKPVYLLGTGESVETPITVEDALNSRMIAYLFRLLQA